MGEKTETKLIKHGKWKEFNKHAVLIAEGVYMNNEKHGLWKEYYDTGTIMIEEHYNNGVQHGAFTSYYPNGQVCSQGHYVNGLREGIFRIYDEQGNYIRNLLFVGNIQTEDESDLVAVGQGTRERETAQRRTGS